MLTRNLPSFPNLSTNRLILRKLSIDDAREIYSLRSNEVVNKYLDRDPAGSIEDAVSFINKIEEVIINNEGLYWAICLKENPRLVGTICYFNFSASENSAEIGYELHPFYHHRGIMSEAIGTVIQFGFQVMQLNLITAFPTADNLDSIRILLKNGFKPLQEGIKPEGNLVRYVLSAH